MYYFTNYKQAKKNLRCGSPEYLINYFPSQGLSLHKKFTKIHSQLFWTIQLTWTDKLRQICNVVCSAEVRGNEKYWKYHLGWSTAVGHFARIKTHLRWATYWKIQPCTAETNWIDVVNCIISRQWNNLKCLTHDNFYLYICLTNYNVKHKNFISASNHLVGLGRKNHLANLIVHEHYSLHKIQCSNEHGVCPMPL